MRTFRSRRSVFTLDRFALLDQTFNNVTLFALFQERWHDACNQENASQDCQTAQSVYEWSVRHVWESAENIRREKLVRASKNQPLAEDDSPRTLELNLASAFGPDENESQNAGKNSPRRRQTQRQNTLRCRDRGQRNYQAGRVTASLRRRRSAPMTTAAPMTPASRM